MTFFRSFLSKLPVFGSMPFYVAGESYGGKMASAFAAALHEAIVKEEIQCQLAGVALGDSLISFPDTVLSYGPYLFSVSLLDNKDFHQVQQIAAETAMAVYKGEYDKAMHLSDLQNYLIAKFTDNVDVYNVLHHNVPDDAAMLTSKYKKSSRLLSYKVLAEYIARTKSDTLYQLMNGPIRKKLGIIPDDVTWSGQSDMVYSSQEDDIPSSVLKDVSKLIQVGAKVVVYQGQLDMICGTLGAESWIKKLKWDGLSEFLNSSRIPLYAPSKLAKKQTGAFLKAHENFYLYYILDAGHMVPIDAPEMALEMLKKILYQ